VRAFDPSDHGLAPAAIADLVGGDVEVNRAIAESILAGEPGAPRDIVLLGAAAALVAADAVDDMDAGLHRAATSIDSGSAQASLARWVEVSQRLR
jgi:anthranilate phosphoribosyltransferase